MSSCTFVFAVLLVAVASGASATSLRGDASAPRRLACSTGERIVNAIAGGGACCAMKDKIESDIRGVKRRVAALKRKTQADQAALDAFHVTQATSQDPACMPWVDGRGANGHTYKCSSSTPSHIFQTGGRCPAGHWQRCSNPYGAAVGQLAMDNKALKAEKELLAVDQNLDRHMDCNILHTFEHISSEIAHDFEAIYKAVKCPLIKKATNFIVGNGAKRISKAECVGFEAGAAGVCEIVGMGPEDPLADVCAYSLVSALTFACDQIVNAAGSEIETLIVNGAGCGSTPSPGSVPVVTGAQRRMVDRLMHESPAARRAAAEAARRAGQAGIASGPERRSD